LTPAARRAIDEAEVLVGARRVLDALPASRAERIVVGTDVAGALDSLAPRVGRQRIAVVVSGDPGACSLAQPVLRRFGRERCRVIPGVSSVQVAFARLGLEWFDATLLSAHAGTPTVAPETLVREPKIGVLAGSAEAMPWIAALGHRLADSHAIFLCESLTLPDERVRQLSAAELAAQAPPLRAIVLLIRREMLA